MGPLASLKVIEIAAMGPAPLAGQLLADLGAEVIVVDRAASDLDITDINRRGKRSIALDLKSLSGREAAKRLIDGADVLIEGFRPGTMEKLGLGPDTFHTSNPGLIYARMTGWGQTGPFASTAGHDINYLSLTGALHAIGPAAEPIPPLNLVADYAGGTMFLIMGILAALFERQRSSLGQIIDAAMVDGIPALMGLIYTFRARGEWSTTRADNMLDGGAPFYRCYRTMDGKFISLGAIEPQFFVIFIKLAGLPEEAVTQQYDRSKWQALAAQIAAVIVQKSQAEWMAVFEGSDACVAPVLTFDEAAQNVHNRERQTYQFKEGVMQASPAPRFSRSAPDDVGGIEAAGTSGEAILQEYGFSKEEIETLRQAKALK